MAMTDNDAAGRRWLVEHGIGETRAALVENGHIVAAHIWRDSLQPHAGQTVEAMLETATPPQARLANGALVVLSRTATGVSEGAAIRVTVQRGPIVERSGLHQRIKPARGHLATADSALTGDEAAAWFETGDDPVERVIAVPPPAADALAIVGWDDLISEAASGMVAFPGGTLLITPTPAMMVIDVDGTTAPAELARQAAVAAAGAIHRFDIGGVIAIDFPTLQRREERQQVAQAFDAAMTGPFERTAVNGFGLMQVVRRRCGASLTELCQLRPVESAILALLRCAERWHQPGDIALVVDAAGATLLSAMPQWIDALVRRSGRAVGIHQHATDQHGYRLEPLGVGG
ncbi:MAG: ribonuclease E/G [Pseudomonadota bacterium]